MLVCWAETQTSGGPSVTAQQIIGQWWKCCGYSAALQACSKNGWKYALLKKTVSTVIIRPSHPFRAPRANLILPSLCTKFRTNAPEHLRQFLFFFLTDHKQVNKLVYFFLILPVSWMKKKEDSSIHTNGGDKVIRPCRTLYIDNGANNCPTLNDGMLPTCSFDRLINQLLYKRKGHTLAKYKLGIPFL